MRIICGLKHRSEVTDLNEDACEWKWQTFEPERTGPGKIFAIAANNGWQRPVKPKVIISANVQEVGDQVADHIASLHNAKHLTPSERNRFGVFSYGGELVEIFDGKIRPIPKDALPGRISVACEPTRMVKVKKRRSRGACC